MSTVTRAVVDADDVVVNIIVVNPETRVDPPDGCRLVAVDAGQGVGAGWIFDPIKRTFAPPAEEP